MLHALDVGLLSGLDVLQARHQVPGLFHPTTRREALIYEPKARLQQGLAARLVLMQVPAVEVPDDLLEIIDDNPHDVFEIGSQGGTRLFELNLLGR